MRTPLILTHKFVHTVPDTLEEGILYVSIRFKTVIHSCCCGCGKQIVTPLSPSDWKLTFDGRTISLYPSIGNQRFPCQSHYWIKGNRVEWASWPDEKEERSGEASNNFEPIGESIQLEIKQGALQALVLRVKQTWLRLNKKTPGD